ncbi:hypothetical protein [Jeotgalibacillus campisalis]|uniref:Uncharacterized protein n=1 Tax=Jeotgalibacillus campisalis TaxID=220754 RepID=A0A0C2RPK8_9BACL|nr:hypothetical protein [Jeotgalibacillus campisalis]KIL43684.1 hypothetical protein KR50_32040 [Jeotgalibacillus campisalis]
MKVLKKTFKIIFLSNLAVVATLILLPAIVITGEAELLNQFVHYISKE